MGVYSRAVHFDPVTREKQTSNPVSWVFADGNPSPREMSDCPDDMLADIKRITMGEKGNVNELLFRDPLCFRAGEIHRHIPMWERILENNPSQHQIMP